MPSRPPGRTTNLPSVEIPVPAWRGQWPLEAYFNRSELTDFSGKLLQIEYFCCAA